MAGEKKTTKYDCIRLGNQLCFPLYACAKEVVRLYRKPLDDYLKSKQGFRGFLMNSPESVHMEKRAREKDPDYRNNSDIKWNFTKFLVNRIGQVVDRFEPDAGTDIVRQAVEIELNR